MSNITTTQQGFAPATLTEAMQFSEMLAKSSMVPRAYQGKAEDVLVAMQWGREIGLAPLQALQNIAVINGKPSVYGDAAMALVQAVVAGDAPAVQRLLLSGASPSAVVSLPWPWYLAGKAGRNTKAPRRKVPH